MVVVAEPACARPRPASAVRRTSPAGASQPAITSHDTAPIRAEQQRALNNNTRRSDAMTRLDTAQGATQTQNRPRPLEQKASSHGWDTSRVARPTRSAVSARCSSAAEDSIVNSCVSFSSATQGRKQHGTQLSAAWQEKLKTDSQMHTQTENGIKRRNEQNRAHSRGQCRAWHPD